MQEKTRNPVAAYVAMTDTSATTRLTLKRIIACETMARAQEVLHVARGKPEMAEVSLHERLPRYSPTQYSTAIINAASLGPSWSEEPAVDFELVEPSNGPDVRYLPVCPAARGTPLERQIVTAALLGSLSVLADAELEELLGHELVPQEEDALDDGAPYWHTTESLKFINEVLIPRLDIYAPQGFSFRAYKNMLGFWPTGEDHETRTH